MNLVGLPIAIYARYSTSNQREASIEDQVRRCREYVVRGGGNVRDEHLFLDMAISGASLVRPGFEAMMDLASKRPPPFAAIVTEDLSRISRDFADSASVFRRLKYLDVPLIGVDDGIDTSAANGKMAYALKAIVSEVQLDDIRAKTRRGLEGRAHAGYSTGGLPYGYGSVPAADGYGKIIGHRIEVDAEQAAVVRRVFNMYEEGRSLSVIAKALNDDKVPPPRVKTRHRRHGWIASTIRAFLRNSAYTGAWSFGKRQWRKVPGTNIRRPRPRPESDVIRTEHPDRRIVDQQTWDEVQARIRRVSDFYTKGKAGAPRASGRRTTHALSGLLKCGNCGASMSISGGTSAKYYGCNDARKRGTCGNRLSLREDVARARIFAAIRDRFGSPEGVRYLRQQLVASVGEIGRDTTLKLGEREAGLRRKESQLANLVKFITDGDDSPAIRAALKALEADVRREKADIAALREQAVQPLRLPDIDVIVRRALDIEEMVAADPVVAREELARWFEGGHITLFPQPLGHYAAEGKLLPLMMFAEPRVESGGLDPRATSSVAREGFEPSTFGL
jgi:DNA invertase Pin-like site-specific DNA recombinase